MNLFIIDAIGPFFLDYKKDKINWSKIPFENIENEGKIDSRKFEKIRHAFSSFAKKASETGYNAVSIDDLAHFSDSEHYNAKTKQKISSYKKEFRKIFDIAKKNNLKVFINTDLMFFNAELQEKLTDDRKIAGFLKASISQLLSEFEIEGIIFRIGETDGADVKDEFLSRLTVKTPGQLNYYIRELLPVFEEHNKLLIMRTWTNGAYEIGDLIWNKKTYDNSFKGIKSNNFVISMKYGNTDFFRHLKLNPLFFHGRQKKIIELQARREREGFGEFPAFIGKEYEEYAKKLSELDNLIGISVWCQTGGWSSFRRLTFIDNNALWSELNTFVALKIFKENYSSGQAAKEFYTKYIGKKDPAKFVRFLDYSDEALSLFYADDFAKQEFYFRRLRIPPLFFIFWDNVVVSDPIKNIHHALIRNPEGIIKNDSKILAKLMEMKKMANELSLPEKDIRFEYDTFLIIAKCREILFGNYNDDNNVNHLEKMVSGYKKKYRNSFNFLINFKNKKYFFLNPLLRLALRNHQNYRLIDYIFLNRLCSYLMYSIVMLQKKAMPNFVDKQAMKAETIFL